MILETILVLLLYKDISFGNKGKFKKQNLKKQRKVWFKQSGRRYTVDLKRN